MSEKSKLPDFEGMTPKEMRRTWARFRADHNWGVGTAIDAQAEAVRFSIDMLILNIGWDAEEWSRRKLEQEFAAFSRLWDYWRG